MLLPEVRHGLLLVGFHTRCPYGVDADEPTFDHRRQHEELKDLSEGVGIQPRQSQVSCRTSRFCVGLIRTVCRRRQNLLDCLTA